MPLAWRKNRHDPPSEYIIYINGTPLTCFLCTMEEAQSTATYDYIRRKFGKDVHAIGVAKGDRVDGECHGRKYPPCVKVIKAPIYYRGSFRADRVEELWSECKTACLSDKAILIHCNYSFHRGPCLLAAIMIKAGITKTAAFCYIAQRRTIYEGHFSNVSEWPLEQKNHHATEKLIEAHEWLEDLESSVMSSACPQEASSTQLDSSCLLDSSSQHARVDWLMEYFTAEELHLAALRKAAAELVCKDDRNTDKEINSLTSTKASEARAHPPESLSTASVPIERSSSEKGRRDRRSRMRSRSPLAKSAPLLSPLRKAASKVLSENREYDNKQTKASGSSKTSRPPPDNPKSPLHRWNSITNSSTEKESRHIRSRTRSRTPLPRSDTRLGPIPPWLKRCRP